uniref:GTP cyclohydrolase 1 feedback regulatory protein-like n=1 Tax=Myxine glutinosa TaxID=7769 RepID=UPI00358F0504
MPYVLVSTLFNDENSPTVVGDALSDPALMRILDAEKVRVYRKKLPEYRVWVPARVVLDKLEEEGYIVKSMTTVEQTIVWCLHKPCQINDHTGTNHRLVSAQALSNQ